MNIHYKLKNLIKNSKNYPNILLYNINTIYCKNTIINVLDDLYNINNITTTINYKNINYSKSLYHFYINIKKIKDFSIFKDLLNDIIQNDNYYINYNKIIILDNFVLNINNQKCIKNLIEKNMNIKFIIISNYNNIYNSLKNLCLCLRIDIKKQINSENNIEYINNILYNNNLYNDIYNKLNKILVIKLNKTKIKDIKTFSYLLLLNNINCSYLYEIILDILIKNKYSFNIIIKINNYFSNLLKYSNINNKFLLLYYEYILINCNVIITNK